MRAMDHLNLFLFKQCKFPLQRCHIMSHYVYRTIVPLYLEISVVRGEPLIENFDDSYHLFTNNESSCSFFSPVSGITLYADIHNAPFLLSNPSFNLPITLSVKPLSSHLVRFMYLYICRVVEV